MRALVFKHAGEAEDVLHLSEHSMPDLQHGEVRVKVTARPIQPADRFFIRGQYRTRPAFPQIAGLEGAGVVDTSNDPAFHGGERVAFRWPGTWAEYIAVPAARLIRVPDEVSDDDACQIALNPITAWALLEEAKAGPGDWIALTAGGSTVSALMAALARARGIRVISLVRGEAARTATTSNADITLSVDAPDFPASVLQATGLVRVSALLDSVGGANTAKLFGVLRPGARVVAYGAQDAAAIPVTNAMLVYQNLTWVGFGIDHWLGGVSADRYNAMLSSLWQLIRAGSLPLPVAGRYRLEQARDALQAESRPDRLGKVLLIA